MTNQATERLAKAALRMAGIGAGEYLRVHKQQADPEALLACMRAWVQIKLPEALNDAKAALDYNMGKIAEATFQATMVQAGIEAAKEAGRPS